MTHSPGSDDPFAGTPLAAHGAAFAVADRETLRITTRRAVGSWSALTASERLDVLALVESLGGPGGRVNFDLTAPAGGRWHICVEGMSTLPGRIPAAAPRVDARLEDPSDRFMALPGFIAGEEGWLIDALRRALGGADEADLLSAFVMRSGIKLLRADLERALRRGARIRVLTGDYLGITAPEALRDLHELAAAFPGMQASIHRSGNVSFHPKAYIFRAGAGTVAYVGSSNLSESALTSGVEWNLRAIDGSQSAELAAIAERFERLWRSPATVALTPAWIDEYAARAAQSRVWEPSPRPLEPHAIQREALAALAVVCTGGARRGLVVLATGLGKTLLAAFFAGQLGAARVLFVAHREEIVTQARDAFERVFPERSTGIYMGAMREGGAELVFASVQTISRPQHLATWPSDRFDLIVIDEFHHAAALTYARVLGHFTPRFLLGITATPERGDGAGLTALCDGNLVFRAGLVEGIERGLLVPFVYHGLKDSVDYAAIPWRSGRFDPEELSRALATRAHAEQALAGYREHAPAGPRRGLWFCASIRHAEFMAAFLREQGIAAAAVHSGAGGAPRSRTLDRLMAGELEAITTVDVFNEGVDAPDIKVVVLLRPTESRIVFQQQIGRGLRISRDTDKPRLVILDFIGNHRSFLDKPQALLGLLGLPPLPAREALRRLRDGDLPLPPGCSVTIETELIDMLAYFAHEHRADALLATFAELRDQLGRRPTLLEMMAAGAGLRAPALTHGSWWDVLAQAGELSPEEARVFAARRAELVALEKAPERAPWPSLALHAWLELGGVTAPVPEAALPAASGSAALVELWPEGLARVGDAIASRTAAPAADQPVLEAMLDEICAARVYIARRARAVAELPTGIPVKVIRNSSGQPILKYMGSRKEAKRDESVWVEGEPYTFKFVSIAINVATARPGGPNVLGALLRGLFGERAGMPGTDYRAVLRERDGRWVLEPALAEPAADMPALPYFADLAVACGLGDPQHAAAEDARPIRVRSEFTLDPRRHFLIRARGDSMNGGARPIRDGDLVLCARHAAPAELVEGKPCLLVAAHGPDASEALIKVVVRGPGDTWILRSWSEGQVDIPVARWEDIRVVARVLGVVPADQVSG